MATFLMTLTTAAAPAGQANGPDSVMICHYPGKDERTIKVSRDELAAHLAHGDYEGGCVSHDSGALSGTSGGTSGATGGTTGGAAGSYRGLKQGNGAGGTTGGAAGAGR